MIRFEREARLLASLNHPNIATLFDLQEHDGVHFLVLESVPGETLAERIKTPPEQSKKSHFRLTTFLNILKCTSELLENARLRPRERHTALNALRDASKRRKVLPVPYWSTHAEK